MLTKLDVSTTFEERSMAAMTGAACRGSKEKWESESSATFHMSDTRVGRTAYKKASPRTTVEVADGNILPKDGFGTVEVDLDQPGNRTELGKMGAVAYMPGLSRNRLSILKAVEQYSEFNIYCRTKTVLGFLGEKSLVFNFCPRKDCFQQQA